MCGFSDQASFEMLHNVRLRCVKTLTFDPVVDFSSNPAIEL